MLLLSQYHQRFRIRLGDGERLVREQRNSRLPKGFCVMSATARPPSAAVITSFSLPQIAAMKLLICYYKAVKIKSNTANTHY